MIRSKIANAFPFAVVGTLIGIALGKAKVNADAIADLDADAFEHIHQLQMQINELRTYATTHIHDREPSPRHERSRAASDILDYGREWPTEVEHTQRHSTTPG